MSPTPLTPSDSQHGTYAGAQRHQREGTPPCASCKAARATYVRQLRAAKPAVRAYDRAYMRARGRALERLAKAHRAEFADYLAEERHAVFDP